MIALPPWWGDPFFGRGNNPESHGERANEETRAAEEWVRQNVEYSFDCRLCRFAKFAAIDFFAVRNGELVGFAEIKTREPNGDVWLNLRKWLALRLAAEAADVPAYFFQLKDGVIRYILLDAINTRRIIIGGQRKITQSRGDIEPVIVIDPREMGVLNA